MTDRELLELAAKAANYTLKKWCVDAETSSGFFAAHLPVPGREGEYPDYWHESYWNPLVDDGDALRLAVKLGIFMVRDDRPIGESENDHTIDPYAATRRAIVRAAADIGKQMIRNNL